MRGSTVIHWHEGLFLQPQHLQVLQQGMLDRFAERQLLSCPYPYGVIACEVSVDAIHNRRLEFERLHVILRSGRHVCIPEDVELPPMDLGPLMDTGPDSVLISIGLPYWSAERGNVALDGAGADGVYRVSERDVLDDVTGGNRQPIQVRNMNARLIANDDGHGGCEALPVLRIRRGVGDQIGKPVLDRTYVPPCCVVEGSRDLRRMLQEMADQVEASRREIVALLVREEFSVENLRNSHIPAMLKLRTLNHFAAKFNSYIHTAGFAPLQWYIALREILGELVALQPQQDALVDCSDYRHEELGPIFADLCTRVRSVLVNVSRQAVLKVEFTERDGLLVASLNDEHMTRPNEYLLAIQTNGDATALSRLVEDPDRFKLMARSRVLRAVRGLRLVEERQPAIELPRQPGLYYFRVDRASEQSIRAWADVQADAEKALAVKRPPGTFTDAKYTLFMTMAK